MNGEKYMNRLSFEKVFYHMDQLYDFHKKNDNYPVHFTIGLTSYCNHRCLFCYGDYETSNPNKNFSIQKDVLLTILKEAFECGLKSVSLVGTGEPLLHKNSAEIIEGIKSIGIEVAVYTNGVMVKGDIAEAILDCCTWVRVSCNAADVNEHNHIHQCKNDFKNIIDNFRNLISKKKKRGAQFPTIGCQFAAFQDNYLSMYDAAKLWKSVGIDYFAIKPVYKHPKNTNQKNNLLDYSKVEQLMEKTLSLQDDSFIVYAKFDQFRDVLSTDYARSYKTCFGHAFSSVILADGKMYLCGNLHSEERYCIGNIYNGDSFKDLWSSEKRKNVIKNIDVNVCPKRCRNDPLNNILWDMKNPNLDIHPNFL